MSKPHRIDTHHHLIPPRYRDYLETRGIQPGGIPLPKWTPAGSLKVMNRLGIRAAVLSVSTPGAWLDEPKLVRGLARELNDYTASVVAENPSRFGFFATLTLPDVDGAIAEAEHAFNNLGADGIVLIANTDGTYLHDPAFRPLLEYLNNRNAVVFVHPGELPAPPVDPIPSFAADFLLDTTRAAAGLVLSGAIEEFSRIRWILAHAGGFLPYVSYRVMLAMLRQEGRLAQAKAMLQRRTEVPKRMELFSRFWFDTALSSSPAAFPALLAVADPSRVLYGSDYPFAPARAIGFLNDVYEEQPLDRQLRRQIDHLNAEALFPRLAA
ncbi:putative TIM-barrel fold metal-dependent hydrolase [Marmoricola sp. OAE513]|uniref:amidohydrolase family protein n=1 Tax=Marmoricola sp. OAE513 TaxID=2817894 RepID=UPI001AE4D078